MLVETDAPFLAPVPHRGQKCEPAFVADTAAFVADLRGEDVEALGEATTANFFKLFPKAAGEARILGCGTSTGVPKIGNEWGRCDPEEPRNRRLRTSIMVESAGENVLVDCGPDLRQQLLAADINRLAAVIVTHAHGDHCHGIDELRPVSQALEGPVPMFARGDVLEELRLRFAYAFAQSDFYRPVVDGWKSPTR